MIMNSLPCCTLLYHQRLCSLCNQYFPLHKRSLWSPSPVTIQWQYFLNHWTKLINCSILSRCKTSFSELTYIVEHVGLWLWQLIFRTWGVGEGKTPIFSLKHCCQICDKTEKLCTASTSRCRIQSLRKVSKALYRTTGGTCSAKIFPSAWAKGKIRPEDTYLCEKKSAIWNATHPLRPREWGTKRAKILRR